MDHDVLKPGTTHTPAAYLTTPESLTAAGWKLSDPRQKFRLVVLESPYAGDVERNLRYGRAAMADCLTRGDAPIASHLLYTQPGVLNDDDPEERAHGIAAGLEWARVAEAVVFYVDLGFSKGMEAALERHMRAGLTIERRRVPDWDESKEETWLGAAEVEDILAGDILTVRRLDATVTGMAHHFAHGAWHTKDGIRLVSSETGVGWRFAH